MPTKVLKQGEVIWTDISNPTQADVTALKNQHTQFHPLHLHDCLTHLEFPKLDQHEEYVDIVIHMPVWNGDERISKPSEVDIFLAHGVLVTAHQGDLKQLTGLFEEVKKDEKLRAKFMEHGASYLLYEILNRLVHQCYPMLHKVNQRIRQIEDDLFSDDTQTILEEIAITRRNVIALRHILRPQIAVIRSLEKGDWEFIHEELDFYWGDIGDQLLQLRSMLDEQFEVINSLSDTIDTLAAHRIDEVVRLLTIVTLMTVPLTVLSTIFGMNFEFPFAEAHPAVFIGVNMIGILLTVFIIWHLKRKKWL